MMLVPSESDEVANIAEPEPLRFTVPSKVALPHGFSFSSRENPGRVAARAPGAKADAASLVLPSSDPRQKLTLPSGDPLGAGLTSAVKVTDCPMPAGLGLADRVVVVVTALLITSLMLFEIEVPKFAFPE
jgi:hypothetical protein